MNMDIKERFTRQAHGDVARFSFWNNQGCINDLGYGPIVRYDEGWKDTIEWFKQNWLTEYNKKTSTEMHNKSAFGSIASQSKRKIDIQAGQRSE